jgi:group I intron endonuclease
MTAGIYVIENLISGKKYIGQGINIKRRMFKDHHGCIALENAIKKYGKENFKKYIVLYCESDKNVLAYYEIACIKIFHSHFSEGGYNISWGGISAMTGRKHSKKSKRKMSEAQLGEKNHFFGKHHTDESIQKISETSLGRQPMLGKHFSKKTKQRMSKAQLGKHLSNETKEKIGNGNRGKHPSDETRQKMSKAQLGKHLSEKTKKLISKNSARFWQGKHLSEETKRKISETKRGLIKHA